MDDLIFKVLNDPKALGAVSFVIVSYIIVIYMTLRFAGKANDNLTKISANNEETESKKQQNTDEVVNKLVELLGSQLEVSKETKQVVANNTAAFQAYAVSFKELKEVVIEMKQGLEEVDVKKIVEEALKPVEELIRQTGEKNEAYLQELTRQLQNVMDDLTLAKDNSNGTSNNANSDPVGQGCTDSRN